MGPDALSAPTTLARHTRGSYERLVTGSADSLKVKTELMDVESVEGDCSTDNDVFFEGEFNAKTNATCGEDDLCRNDSNLQDCAMRPVDVGANRGYTAVVTARAMASCPRQLNPRQCSTEVVSTGSFANKGDDRIGRAKLTSNLALRTNITRSFDLITGKCCSCLAGPHDAQAARGGGPVAYMAADQSFPACVPVGGAGGECLRVVRVESGSLREITLALADSIVKEKMVTGTVICIGSISHLASVGTAQYCMDWVRSRWWLKERFGKDVVVAPLPPVPVAGLRGSSIIRALVETSHWFTALEDTEALVMRPVFDTLTRTFLCTDTGSMSTGEVCANGRQCFRLPASLDSHATISVVSEGWGSRPDGIPPLTQAAEEILISSLLTSLNNMFSLGLCLTPCMERDCNVIKSIAEAAGEDANYLVVGGSHARRLAMAMGEAGVSLERITSGGWKITSSNVTAMLQKIEELHVKPDVFVMQIFDNSSYFCLGEDGTLTFPQVENDGRHHVVGELRVATKEQVKAMLKTITPLLHALPDSKKLIISCLPRYVSRPCCNVDGHMQNFDQAARERILTDLNAMKRAVRSHLYTEKIANAYIVDPIKVCNASDSTSFLDPVHLTPDRYSALAGHLIRLAAGSEKDDTEEESGPASKRAKTGHELPPQYGGARRGSARGRGGFVAGGRGRAGGGGRGGRRGRGSNSFYY